jgi:uncharacterized repeat protein (TIGR01451 family)
MKMSQNRLIFTLFFFLSWSISNFLQAQNTPTITNTASANGFMVKKQVSNSTVPSGVVFTYTIFYTIPAGATNVVISDQVPATLVIDNVVPGSGCGTPVVNTTGNLVTYSLASVASGCSGTFQINVHFPAGTTCPGATARNQVCLEAQNQPKLCTDFISTTATANNPFVVSKGVTGLSWNPQNNGCQYIMSLGGNVTYTLYVYKGGTYQGNDDGQINLNSAVVTDVLPAGATLVSSTCGITQSGNTLTWNVGNLNAASPWVWLSCQVTVNYPAASFPVGTQIPNTATLAGVNACNQQYSVNSNTTCVQVAAPISSGTFSKGIYLNNKMPGCQGIYYLTTCNNGNTPLTFSIQDVLPAGVTVNSVSFSASASVTSSATLVNTTVSTISSSQTGNINWTAPNSSPVASLSFTQTGLAAAACLQIQILFTINTTVAANTTITNCANLTSTQIPAQQSCVSFVTTAAAPDLCLYKDICSPQIGYQPGNIFRYRLRVQNIGSANANNFNLNDILDPNLIYVGNQIAYSSSNYNPPCGGTGATVWPIANPTVSGNNLTWNNLSIPAECQNFYYANCGAYGTQGVTFYFIEFDVQVAPDAASGIVPNTFTGNGGNLTAPETGNTVNTIVNVTHGTDVTKEISKDNVTWGPSTTVTAGGNLWYRLNIKNTGTGALYDVRKVDLLAMDDAPNDWKIFTRTVARGSQFGVNTPSGYAYSVVATPAVTGTAGTMAGNNLSLLNALGVSIGSTADTWPYAGSGNNLGIGFGAAYGLSSLGTLRSSFKVIAAANAAANQQTCNDFAARGAGKYIINSSLVFTPLTPAASNTVCATVVAASCCEKTVVQPTGKCCLKLTTECEVKQIQVAVQGGTISTASWNCTASLGAYQGQSTFSFAPNGCVPTLNMCFDALSTNTTGVISVTITLIFSNGEQCVKQIKLDGCTPVSCCDKTVIEASGKCCLKVATTCEVKQLTVAVQGGTINNATWNCAASLGAYQGLGTFNFFPNSCAPTMNLCFDALPTNTSGVITVTITIFFSNGEQCIKELKLDGCSKPPVPSDCCGKWGLKFKNSHNKKIGIFSYVNPSTKPICSVTILAAAGLTAGAYNYDGGATLSMTSTTLITFGPPALNTINFWVSSSLVYSSNIQLQVNYCDGTYCRDTLKWKGSIINHDVSTTSQAVNGKLFAVRLQADPGSKYIGEIASVAVSLDQIDATADSKAYIFAATAGKIEGETLNSEQNCAVTTSMSASYVYAVFPSANDPEYCGKAYQKGLALVIADNTGNKVAPPLLITYFDADGNVLNSKKLTNYQSGDVTTATIDVKNAGSDFMQVNVYPNPAKDQATLTYAIGRTRTLRIDLYDAQGQFVQTLEQGQRMEGFHKVDFNTSMLPGGMYFIRLLSDGMVQNQRLSVVK